MSRTLRFLPLVLLLLFVGAVAWRIATPKDDSISSKLVGKPLPDLVLQPAIAGKEGIRLRDSSNSPRVINLFASWCVPCIAEAPVLLELTRQGMRVDGIAVRDRPQDVADFLASHGDPFGQVGADPESRVQIALGSSGVPETFIVDAHGTIRYQHIGPIEFGDIPAIREKWESLRK